MFSGHDQAEEIYRKEKEKRPNIHKPMTDTQKQQFNHMRKILRKIAKGYQTPEQLYKNCVRCEEDYIENLEMAYENLQNEAANAVRGVREIKL